MFGLLAAVAVGFITTFFFPYSQFSGLCRYAAHCHSLDVLCSVLGTAPECSPGFPNTHPGYFEYECAGKPHQSSWSSWWHPQRSEERGQHDQQSAGTITSDWNILYHLGGNGPWVEKIIDVVEGGIGVPSGCEVEQVHLMARHGERYPTRKAGMSRSFRTYMSS